MRRPPQCRSVEYYRLLDVLRADKFRCRYKFATASCPVSLLTPNRGLGCLFPWRSVRVKENESKEKLKSVHWRNTKFRLGCADDSFPQHPNPGCRDGF